MESFLFCRAYTIGAFDKVFAEESAPEHFPRDRTFHLRHIRLDVVLDEEAGEVRGTASLRLSPLNDGLQDIDLDGEDLHIRKVPDQEDRSLEIEYDSHKRRITPGRVYKTVTDSSLRSQY